MVELPAHAGEGPAAGAASQPQQHGLGLVVEGVPEQHQGGAEVLGHLVEHRVASLPRGRLEPATAALDGDPDAEAVSSAPSSAICATTCSACAADSSWRPWSTVTPKCRNQANLLFT